MSFVLVSLSIFHVNASVPVSVQRIYWNAIYNTANQQVGKPYSTANRKGPDSYDCSGLAYYCYISNGHSITENSAADQAFQMANDGRSSSIIQQSYLSFYDYNKTPNGRYLDIDHVSIFAGNGMMIDASSSNGRVVYRSYSTMSGDIVMKAKPETWL